MFSFMIIVVYVLFGASLLGLSLAFYEIWAIRQFKTSYYRKAIPFHKYEYFSGLPPDTTRNHLRDVLLSKAFEATVDRDDHVLFYKKPWAFSAGGKLFGQFKITALDKETSKVTVFFKTNMALLSFVLFIPGLLIILLGKGLDFPQVLLKTVISVGFILFLVSLLYVVPVLYYKKKVIPSLLLSVQDEMQNKEVTH